MPKYSDRNTAILNNQLYFDVLESKGVKSLRITRTTDFSELAGKEFGILEERVWRYQDSLYKLAFEYYGEYKNWWVIAMLNNKPTDAHYSVGDIVYIPSNPYYIAGLIK